jgi:hypothetical protein
MNERLEGQDNYIPDAMADHIHNKARSALIYSPHMSTGVKQLERKNTFKTSSIMNCSPRRIQGPSRNKKMHGPCIRHTVRYD